MSGTQATPEAVLDLLRLKTAESIEQARLLCSELPSPQPLRGDPVTHAKIATALTLESVSRRAEALELYASIAQSPDCDPHERNNAIFRTAVLHEEKGELDQALAAYRQVAGNGDGSSVARMGAFHLASLLGRLKRYGEAVAHLDALLEAGDGEPSRLAIEWKKAALQIRDGHKPALPSPPASILPLEALSCLDAAHAHDEVGDLASALSLYRTALDSLALDPVCQVEALRRVGVTTRRLEARRGASDLPADSETVQALHAEVWHHLQAGGAEDLDQAERLCHRFPIGVADELAPLMAHITMSTAFALEQQGHLARAESLYRRVLQEPHSDGLHLANAAFRIGLLASGRGHQSEAVSAWKRAFETPGAEPIQILAALHLAHTLINEPERALDITERALSLPGPESTVRSMLFFNRIVFLTQLCRIDIDDIGPASELPSKLDSLDEGVATAWIQAAFALEGAGRYSLARLFYQRLLQATSLPAGMRANVHYRLGIVLDSLFAYDEAARQFRASVSCPDPFPVAQAAARHCLAGLHYMLEDFEAAAQDYDELRTLPELGAYQRAEAQLKYATCLLRLGRLDAAGIELRRCREVESGGGTDVEVKADLLLCEIAEQQRDPKLLRDCLERVMQNPASEPVIKAAALAKLQRIPR